MRTRWRAVAAAALAVSLLPTATPVNGAALGAGTVTGWAPYWLAGSDSAPAVTSITNATAHGVMTEMMPFWYSATGATTIAFASGATNTNLLRVTRHARSKGLRVIPSVTDGTGRLVMQGILAVAETRSAHADALVQLVLTGVDGISFDGIDLDYEGFAFSDPKDETTKATTRAAWLAFLEELGGKLRAQGKLLSVTVPPRWDGDLGRYSMYGLPSEIAARADRLRLMVYDWSVGAPGPIAPMSWVDDVISFLRRDVPAADLAKVWLGVPQHGRSWARIASGECPDELRDANGTRVSMATTSVTAVNAPNVVPVGVPVATVEGERTARWTVGTFTGIKTAGTPPPPPYSGSPTVVPDVTKSADGPALDPAVRVPLTTTRTVTCTVERVVHYPDDDSVVLRAHAAQTAGLAGIVLWALGYEPSSLWPALQNA